MSSKSIRFQGIQISRRNVYLEIPTVGYQGFKSVYRPATVSINHRKDPFFNLNPLKPRLKDLNLQNTNGFDQLSDGFKSATIQSTKNTVGVTGEKVPQEAVKIPVTGYTGHRMGYKA